MGFAVNIVVAFSGILGNTQNMRISEGVAMSNRLFQGVIHQMRDAIDRTIGVIDETSVIIACSELGRIGEVNESITAEVDGCCREPL